MTAKKGHTRNRIGIKYSLAQELAFPATTGLLLWFP